MLCNLKNSLNSTKNSLFLTKVELIVPFFVGLQDRRHIPLQNPIERRHTLNPNFHSGNDRRHLNNLPDRRHISPPLHINICDNSNAILNTAAAEGMHPRNLDFSHPQRRLGRGLCNTKNHAIIFIVLLMNRLGCIFYNIKNKPIK